MTGKTCKTLLTIIGFALASVGVAEDEAIPAVSAKPLQAMQRLAPLAGEWDMTVHMSADDGQTWNASPAQAVSLEYGHKGFMLEEKPATLDGPGFHMHTWLTYDQYREVYRKAALDDVWGIFDLYEGSIQDGRLVLTNLAAGTYFPLGDGTWRGFRLTIELKSDERWIWIDKTDDDGASWQPAFKVQYLRRAG